MIASNSGGLEVKIGLDEKISYPLMKHHILSFQPSTSQTIPTWIYPNTNWKSQAAHVIVLGHTSKVKEGVAGWDISFSQFVRVE